MEKFFSRAKSADTNMTTGGGLAAAAMEMVGTAVSAVGMLKEGAVVEVEGGDGESPSVEAVDLTLENRASSAGTLAVEEGDQFSLEEIEKMKARVKVAEAPWAAA